MVGGKVVLAMMRTTTRRTTAPSRRARYRAPLANAVGGEPEETVVPRRPRVEVNERVRVLLCLDVGPEAEEVVGGVDVRRPVDYAPAYGDGGAIIAEELERRLVPVVAHVNRVFGAHPVELAWGGSAVGVLVQAVPEADLELLSTPVKVTRHPGELH